jgi:pimeloyl-ACP methyl ester carboxylesterase
MKLFARIEGAGQPILLVHGFPLDHSMWSGQLAGLSNRFRLIAVDLPGVGQSPLDSADSKPVLTMEQMADDLARALDELKISEPVVFCGLSMGGYVAWQFWKRHRQRLARLILCDTRAAADSPEAAQNRRQLADRILAEGSQVAAEVMLPKLFGEATKRDAPQLVESVKSVALATPAKTLAAALLGMAVREDMTATLPTVDAPALVICGEDDVISPPAEMRSIAEAMPRAVFELIPAAGHLAPLERPEIVNQAILRFLKA